MKTSVNHPITLCYLAALLSAWICLSPSVRAMNDEVKKRIIYDMYKDYKADFKSVADISPLEVIELTKSKEVVLVDVRSPEEMSVSMLPGAISQEEYLENRERMNNRIIVAYCTVGYRSGVFAEKMAGDNIPGGRIYNLRGGMLAWALEGGKVYQKQEESRRIHVYGKRWNYPPEGYESVW